jgi:hypothetical protein
MVSILDTPISESFSRYFGSARYKGGEKILRGDTYTKCWEKVWEWPPITIGEPGAGQAMTGGSILPRRNKSVNM